MGHGGTERAVVRLTAWLGVVRHRGVKAGREREELRAPSTVEADVLQWPGRRKQPRKIRHRILREVGPVPVDNG